MSTILDRPLSSLRVVFVDDEGANCRLGLRLLQRLGVARENVVFLANGEAMTPNSPCAQAAPLVPEAPVWWYMVPSKLALKPS